MKLNSFLASLLIAAPCYGQLTTEPVPNISIVSPGFNLDWHGQLNRGYFIQWSDDLINWSYIPEIAHGTDSPLGYAFNTSGERIFLRLQYTEEAVTDPINDDYDGDGISNWDEVREGGSGTDPFVWSTNGDSKSDYYADSNGNGMFDGWEAVNGNLGDLNPYADGDDDGLTNAQESIAGTQADNAYSDGDGVKDGEDAVPLDELINWKKTAVKNYAYIELGQPADVDNLNSITMSEKGHVLVGATPIGLHVVKYYIWSPTTGEWSAALKSSCNGVEGKYVDATSIDNYGRIIGKARVVDEDGEGTASGAYEARVEWANAEADVQISAGSRLAQAGDSWGVFAESQVLSPKFAADNLELSMLHGRNGYGTGGEAAMVELGGVPLDKWWDPFANIPDPYTQNQFGDPESDSRVLMNKTEWSWNFKTEELEESDMGSWLFDNGYKEELPFNVSASWVAQMPDENGILGKGRIAVSGYYTWIKKDGVWSKTKKNLRGGRITSSGQILIGGDVLWQNGEERTLEEACPALGEQQYTYYGVQDMADNGSILIQGGKESGERVTAILLPVGLAVDANRDGDIKFDILDETTEDKPHRFWVNDDCDVEEDTEEPASGNRDNVNASIATSRDLEDFTRMWMKCPFSIDQLKSGKIQIGFKWENHSGAGVNIYLSADSEGSLSYLSDQSAGNWQASVDYGGAIAEVIGTSTVYLPNGIFYKTGVLKDGKLCFIFEGVFEGKGRLVPVFKIGGVEQTCKSSGIWFHLLNVREMYERVKITPDDPDNFTEPSDFVGETNNLTVTPPVPNIGWTWDPWGNDPVPDPEEEKEYLIFVHGWNMTYNGAQKYGETMYKRLWQSGYKGRYAFVRWPTYTGVTTYNASDYRAWLSGKGVAAFVNSLSAEYVKNIAAHSMGNIVVGSALREGMKVDNYALLNAAVPAMCYDEDESLYVFPKDTPDGDADPISKALGFKGQITDENVRKDVVNFYLSDDSALTGSLDVPIIGESLGWEQNNKFFKPETFNLGTTGYFYNRQRNPGTRVYINFKVGYGVGLERHLRVFHEAVAYATASRTKTVGADGRTASAINDSLDLDS